MTISLGQALDYAGVGFFAFSGALAAAERRQDVVAFLFFGAITGIGGGTLRDLLIASPVFWVREPAYLVICSVAASLVWLSGAGAAGGRALLWMDAVGLSAYAVLGASKSSAAGLGAPVCLVMGVLTACFGGVLRDVVAGQPSVLLQRRIYVTAAMAAAAAFLTAHALGLPLIVCNILGFGMGLVLRGGALLYGWSLPAFGERH